MPVATSPQVDRALELVPVGHRGNVQARSRDHQPAQAAHDVGEDGQECAPGEAGEVWVAGKHIMIEYWNRPDATAETIVDGWLRTGDVATMNEEGFVSIQDRIKDMIISGGENVYPAEVENTLFALEGVADGAIIGVPDEKWGEVGVAFVVKAEGANLTEDDVLGWFHGKVARFKMPVKAVFIDELPRNATGKVLKRVLRDQAAG